MGPQVAPGSPASPTLSQASSSAASAAESAAGSHDTAGTDERLDAFFAAFLAGIEDVGSDEEEAAAEMRPQVRQRAPLLLRYTIFPCKSNILLRGDILRDAATLRT